MVSLSEVLSSFHSILPNKNPYDYQVRCWEKILRIEPGQGLFIEAQTAGGKTEAATLPLITALAKGDYALGRRLIYVLPNRSLVNAMAARLRRDSEKVGELRVVIDHGGTLEPTPMFYGDIVVCTWDSFFYGYAATRSLGERSELPIGNIAVSFVIFDEVHMLQEETLYSIYLLANVLDQLRFLQVPFVVMTATMATKIRDLLRKEGDLWEAPRESDANRPTRGTVKILEDHNPCSIKLEDALKDPSVQRMVRDLDRVLVMADTVEGAVKAFLTLRKLRDDVVLLHSRLMRRTRSSTEETISKTAESDGRILLVATQVVEAGLNIDFQLVITEMAPIEPLIQRLGRGGRKGGKAHAIICGYPGYPYPAELVESAEHVIKEKGVDELERALLDLDMARTMIDPQYDLWGKISREDPLSKAKLFLTKRIVSDLSPLRLAPNFRSVSARPGAYVTLVVPPDQGGEALSVRELLERSFNVSYDSVSKKLPEAIKARLTEITLSRAGKPIARKIKAVRPWGTYEVDPSFYCVDDRGYELGVVSLWRKCSEIFSDLKS